MSAQPVEAEPCVRRWYSVSPSCGCTCCARLRLRRRKLRDAGTIPKHDSTQALRIIEAMVARGWTPRAVATACGITDRYALTLVSQARAGSRARIGPRIAALIENHGEPTAGYVGAMGTRRRTQALALAGYDLKDVAAASGVGWTTIAAIRTGKNQMVRPHIAAAVERAYQRLAVRPGPSSAASLNAVKRGWVGIGAWDEIDDPLEIPRGIVGEVTA